MGGWEIKIYIDFQPCSVCFQVYTAAVNVKRKLKNGTCSVKPKPLFPGCVFLRCVLNREIHDFIRECEGVGGFVGSKVGNTWVFILFVLECLVQTSCLQFEAKI